MRRVGGLSTTALSGTTLLCAIASLHPSPAAAETGQFTPSQLTHGRMTQSRLSWGGSLALTSDYVYRGLSQTEGRPAVQGEVHVRSESGWSLGMRASTVNRGQSSGARSEIDLQLAQSWSFGSDWSLQLSANHYFYPDDNRSQPYEYDEFVASLSYQNRLTATLAWSPNTSRFGHEVFVRDQTARSYELTALQPLSPSWSLFSGAGYHDLNELFATGYWYWNAGVTYCLGNLQIDLSHIDTDHTARRLFDYEVGKRQWIAALSWRF